MGSTRSDTLGRLASQDRRVFLAALVRELGLRARGHYVEAGASETGAVAGLRCINELVLVVGAQISSDMAGQPEYPDDALLTLLEEKAQGGGCMADLHWAIASAIAAVRR